MSISRDASQKQHLSNARVDGKWMEGGGKADGKWRKGGGEVNERWRKVKSGERRADLRGIDALEGRGDREHASLDVRLGDGGKAPRGLPVRAQTVMCIFESHAHIIATMDIRTSTVWHSYNKGLVLRVARHCTYMAIGVRGATATRRTTALKYATCLPSLDDARQ